MPPKSDIELARLAIAKVTRKEIRTKYEIMADAEINQVLHQRLAEFDAAVQSGRLPGLSLKLITDDTTVSG